MLVTNFIFNSKHALCNILRPFVLFQASNADKAYLYASFFSFVSNIYLKLVEFESPKNRYFTLFVSLLLN